MLKLLNESFVTVITTDNTEGSDNVIEVLKSYRFIEDIIINRNVNLKPSYGIFITCNDPNVTVNGKLHFRSIHDTLLIGMAKYTVISVDGAIATFDDKDECFKYHMTKRNELLGKLRS